MIICNNCGTQLPDGTRICTFCGADLAVTGFTSIADPQPSPPQQQYIEPYSGAYQAPVSGSYYGQQTVIAQQNGSRKTILIIAAIIVIAAIAGIIWMLTSGYYSPYGKPISADSPVKSQDVRISNAGNESPVAVTDDQIYVIRSSNENYSINRVEENGSYTEIYSSPLLMSSLNGYAGRLYFLSSQNGINGIFSVDTSGKNFKEEKLDNDIDSLFVYGSNLYYTLKNYGADGQGAAVFRIDLLTGNLSSIAAADNAFIYNVIEYNDRIFIQYHDGSDYCGHIMTGPADGSSKIKKVDVLGDNEDMYGMTVSDGLVYFSNLRDSYDGNVVTELYSMSLGCTDAKLIGDFGGYQMLTVGDYIYYADIYNTDTEDRSISYQFRRVNKNGKDDTKITDDHVYRFGYDGNKIWCFDADNYSYFWISTDGKSSGS